MLQRLPANNPPIRIILQQARQQIRRIVAAQRLHRHKVCDRPLRPFGEFRIVMRQPIHAVPIRVRIGSPPPLKYFDQLINIGSSWKQGQPSGHFGKDAPDTPDINGSGVAGCPKEKFGGAVPEGDDFVGIRSVG